MMGPTRRRKSTSQYDPDLYENWTMVRLKEELRNRGIRFPINAKRMVLVRLLTDKKTMTQQQFLPHDIDSYAQVNSSLLSSARSHDSAGAGGVANTREDNAENGSARSHDAAHLNNNGGFHSNRVLIGLVSKLSSTVQSLQHDVLNLTEKLILLFIGISKRQLIVLVSDQLNLTTTIYLREQLEISIHLLHSIWKRRFKP